MRGHLSHLSHLSQPGLPSLLFSELNNTLVPFVRHHSMRSVTALCCRVACLAYIAACVARVGVLLT